MLYLILYLLKEKSVRDFPCERDSQILILTFGY